MKKQIVAVILLIGLSSGTMLPNVMRHVHCLFKPSKPKLCSKEEIQAARAWLGRNSLKALGALLLAAGATAATIFAVKQLKKRQIQKEAEGVGIKEEIAQVLNQLRSSLTNTFKHEIIIKNVQPLLDTIKKPLTKEDIAALEPLKEYLRQEVRWLGKEESEYRLAIAETYFKITQMQPEER